jgi:hypothetical protein
MCTVLLPPGDNPIAVNKYIMSYYTHDDENLKHAQQLVYFQELNLTQQ